MDEEDAYVNRKRNYPSSPNSWEWVRINREFLQNSTDYPAASSMEYFWKILEEEYNRGWDERIITRDEDEGLARSPIEAFLFFVDLGYSPPPEILNSVATCFQTYLAFKGDIDLESIFFGPPQKGIGNYAARKAREFDFTFFYFELSIERSRCKSNNKKPPSLIDFAEQYIKNNGLNVDPESFVRNARRQKNRKTK